MERQCSNPNCQTATTPSWRRIKGQLFCNACAIYSRRHQGKLRPKRKLKTQKKSLPKQRQTNKKTKNTRKRLNQRILITNTSKKHTKGNNFAKQRKLLKKKSSPKTILKKNRIPNYTIINQTLPQNQKQQSQRLLKTIKLKQKKQQYNKEKEKEKEKEKGKGKETETNHKQQNSKNEKNLFSSLLNYSFPNYSSQINNSSKGVDQIQNKDEDNEKIKSSYCGKKLPDFLLKNSNVQFQIPTQTLTQIPTHKQQKPAQITQTSQQNNFFSRNFNQNIFPSNNSNILNNTNYKDDSLNINQNNFCFKNGNDHSKQNKNKNQNKPQNGFENFECKRKENINSNSIVYSKSDQKSERKIGKESKPNQESKNETEQEKNAQDQEEFKEIPRKMCVTTLQAGDCVGLLLRDGDEVFAIIRKFVKEKGENGYRYCKVTWLVPKNDIQNTRISPTNLSRNHFFIGLDEPLPQSLQSITRKLNFRVL